MMSSHIFFSKKYEEDLYLSNTLSDHHRCKRGKSQLTNLKYLYKKISTVIFYCTFCTALRLHRRFVFCILQSCNNSDHQSLCSICAECWPPFVHFVHIYFGVDESRGSWREGEKDGWIRCKEALRYLLSGREKKAFSSSSGSSKRDLLISFKEAARRI